MRIGLTESRSVRGTEQAGGILIEQLFGPGAIPLPNIGSMDGDAGCSEGATAEKVVPFSCAIPRSQPFRSLCAPSAGRVECTRLTLAWPPLLIALDAARHTGSQAGRSQEQW